MDFNKKFLDRIDNIINKTSYFDSKYKIAIDYPTELTDHNSIQTVYSLTNYYKEIRQIHGELIIMLNEFTQNTKSNKSDNQYNYYDLSVFSSIIDRINELVNNIDYEYKRIAIKYSKLIINEQLKVLLIINKTKKEQNKYIKMIDELKLEHPENIYEIVEYSDDFINSTDKKKCEEILQVDNLEITTVPTLFVKNSIVVEIPLNKIKDIDMIKKQIIQ